MREKIKMVLYIWKKLKEELDDIVSLYEREGRSLKKTEVVSEALSKEVIKRKLEYLSKKLSVLQNIDLDCLASKLYRIRLRLLSLSEDEMAKVTGRIASLMYSSGKISRVEEEEDERVKEIRQIARFLALPYSDSSYMWDSDTVAFLILNAIEDCKGMGRKTEELLNKYAW